MSQEVSIVVPCYNEEGNVRVLFERLTKVMAGKADHQIVFVDDGSTDDTLKEVQALARTHNTVKYISLSRNFGHQYALKAALDRVDADCVIMMDADLQHPPEFVEKMIDKWREGYDVVYTVRKDDGQLSWLKRQTSSGFYRLMNRMGSIHMEEGAADFRLIDRKVLRVFKEELNEYYFFMRGLVSWVGFKQYALEYTPGERYAGTTKYSFLRMLSFAINGITSFSVKPLRLSMAVGLLISLFAGAYGIYVIGARLFINQVVPGWTSVIICVLFIGGIQMLMLGIIGEYVGKGFYEIKRRPKYIIKDTNL